MAIFTADEYGGTVKKCWLGKKDVTRLTTCAGIPFIVPWAVLPPFSNVLRGLGWVDLLDTTEKGYPYFIVGDDDKPVTTRHYGIVKLEWANA